MMFYTTYYHSPIGKILMSSDGQNLTGLWFEGQKYFANTLRGISVDNKDLAVFLKAKDWLDTYFNHKQPEITDLPLAPEGSPFQQEVWKILCDIPYGKVMTYGEIAKKIARQRGMKAMSAQAVGGAIGGNPISIIIPCHRVIGSNGSLTGYAGGIKTKIALLALENVDMTRLFPPKKETENKNFPPQKGTPISFERDFFIIRKFFYCFFIFDKILS